MSVADDVKVSNIGPHFGEEPCIQGHHGSGAVFFSGCNLRCVFCQNYDIAHQRKGFDLTPQVLGEWYVKLQDVGGVHNINLVTPEHVVPQVVLSILHAAELGLKLPVVYNTSAFDSLESLQLLDGLIDIYMPDFKVWKKETSKRLLKAEDYAASAMKSIMAMHDQVGDLMFTPDGIAKRGLLVRHLIMPGKTDESEAIMQWFGSYVSQDVFVNLMEQYRPDAHVGKPRRSRGSSDKGPSLDGESSQASSLDHLRYHEINREVKSDEIAFVREAAKVAGLWRFCDPPQHSGFNL